MVGWYPVQCVPRLVPRVQWPPQNTGLKAQHAWNCRFTISEQSFFMYTTLTPFKYINIVIRNTPPLMFNRSCESESVNAYRSLSFSCCEEGHGNFRQIIKHKKVQLPTVYQLRNCRGAWRGITLNRHNKTIQYIREKFYIMWREKV